MIDLSSRDGQFVGVSMTTDRHFGDRTFRVLIYGAQMMGGGFASEHNGIAVIDLDTMHVVLDDHARESSGYYGPSTAQIQAFGKIVKLDWRLFRAFCNAHKRSRYRI